MFCIYVEMTSRYLNTNISIWGSNQWPMSHKTLALTTELRERDVNKNRFTIIQTLTYHKRAIRSCIRLFSFIQLVSRDPSKWNSAQKVYSCILPVIVSSKRTSLCLIWYSGQWSPSSCHFASLALATHYNFLVPLFSVVHCVVICFVWDFFCPDRLFIDAFCHNFLCSA